MHAVGRTPLEWFYHWEQERPNHVFLRQPCDGDMIEYTWSRVGEELRSMVSYFREQGFEEGDRIGIIARNSARWVMADLAIMMLGGVSVPLYPSQSSESVRYILDHADVKLLFVGNLDQAGKTLADLPLSLKTVDMSYGVNHDFSSLTWEEIIGQHEPLSDSPQRNPQNLTTIVYTSGTTGRAKGVMHSAEAMAFVARNFYDCFQLKHDDRFFSYLPLAHVAERSLLELTSIYGGICVTFMEHMDHFLRDLKSSEATAFFTVPRLWSKFQSAILEKVPQKKLDRLLALPLVSYLVKRKLKSQLGFASVRSFGSGAAPISVDLLKWYQKVGIDIKEGYGHSENLAYATTHQTEPVVCGSVGQALPGCDIKIDQDGEILIKSPATMLGYYLDPESTMRAMENGFFKTGDLGKLDDQGHLTIRGRCKDIFKTEKGKYIAPSQIEGHLDHNRYIEQICVTGHGLPQPVALVVPSPESSQLNRADLTKYLEDAMELANRNLQNYEKVKNFIVVKEAWTVESGLMTPTLKMKRHMIEEKYRAIVETSREHRDSVLWEERG
ncbi:AMP-binding protein [Pseudobacteriovorax antillogorgiicola]|uniref:Long-chain acyl-CoA synthetase n=1 Tax=Pseudobacteriovorax antillogorgiicola TaxID=1513793 RepID=A0A1Y6CNH3_9BACT|nr:AMP-binding protein [Pseudobacteriovorax antillogorgiicola]TCS46938.1 long-chain acyl-CoA synthetase [Pseudobacteriovorax antillogorgiicola]SMF64373.1 long-chain acyl-CoA synthetase [Pseudobacteriovorax antillogorgiicola]